MRRRRGRSQMHLNAEINVVSLIDVMMLLLVIFMLTAPMMQGGVDVRLPEANARPVESKSGLTVTVDRSGTIYINDEKMAGLEAFKEKFPIAVQGKEKQGVNLRGDTDVNLGMIVRVMEVINAAGVTSLGFVTVPQGSGGGTPR